MLVSKDLPPVLKNIGSYLDRAQEFRGRDPVVSFYCRRYALELVVKDHGRTKDKAVMKVLLGLMDEVEQEKAELGAREELADSLAGQVYVEDFALKLFKHADNQDRNGKGDKNTAKVFLAASLVMDVLQTFGELSPEIDEKRKYSKYKTVYITKCLREGTIPIPGPPGEQAEDLPSPPSIETSFSPHTFHPSKGGSDEFGFPLPPPSAPPSAPSAPSAPKPTVQQPPSPSKSQGRYQQPSNQLPNKSYGQTRVAGSVGRIPKNINDVTDSDVVRVNKLCRFVMSSLQ
eukprot:Ihof_evm3s260 gene=Ihof_evmTU3s260